MKRCRASLSLLLALLFASGCVPKAKPSEPTTPPAAAVTLLRLENGDRACYVVVQTANNTEASMEGDFDLCEGGSKDATALIGHQITYTTKKANVLAASCEGNPDCGKSDEVDLVISITKAD